MSDEEFDAEIALASEGRWEELFAGETLSIEEFMRATES